MKVQSIYCLSKYPQGWPKENIYDNEILDNNRKTEPLTTTTIVLRSTKKKLLDLSAN